ncbi:hypothetical protein, partial [Rhizobium sp. UBA1881]|uniref:hypothetical protein n=1 Tax=Rhizobium sp. UBA1881 TaxID=1947375 RepID=UPI0025D727AD
GLSLPDGYQALTAIDPPVATITERRIPNLALPVREPGSLSHDMAIVERHRMTGMNEDDDLGQGADCQPIFVVRGIKFCPPAANDTHHPAANSRSTSRVQNATPGPIASSLKS